MSNFALSRWNCVVLTCFCSHNLDSLPPDQDPNDLSFGNAVYQIRFDDRERRPMFGHRYSFFLKDAVEDVPEYIVHWDNFVQFVTFLRHCNSTVLIPLSRWSGWRRSISSSCFIEKSFMIFTMNITNTPNSVPYCRGWKSSTRRARVRWTYTSGKLPVSRLGPLESRPVYW